jgi:hypothetical protein
MVENYEVKYVSCSENVSIFGETYDHGRYALFDRLIWGRVDALLMPIVFFFGDYGACFLHVFFRVFPIILLGWVFNKTFSKSAILAKYPKILMAVSYAYWISIFFLILDYLQSYFQESKTFFITLALQMWLPQLILKVFVSTSGAPKVRYRGRKKLWQLKLKGAIQIMSIMVGILACIFTSWCWGRLCSS